jgi:V-type H+-transporting ATPase subunit E
MSKLGGEKLTEISAEEVQTERKVQAAVAETCLAGLQRFFFTLGDMSSRATTQQRMQERMQEEAKQVHEVQRFVLAKASHIANAIAIMSEEEFSVEVSRLVSRGKHLLRLDYEQKTKHIDVQHTIARSKAVNKQRLEKMRARENALCEIQKDVKTLLATTKQSEEFLTKLIVQGQLMLLEPEVMVRCRECDKELVESCLDNASQEYARIIKEETGATKSCKLRVAEGDFLPASSLGGVSLSCFGGKISIDNTVDARLELVMQQAKPAIRARLFPTK